MIRTSLFRVEGESTCCDEPLSELVRARSPAEAAEIVHSFWASEMEESVVCERLTVQLLREPLAGTGVVYEAARQEDRFAVIEGLLIPVSEDQVERAAIICLS
jgi:hypothetical protein